MIFIRNCEYCDKPFETNLSVKRFCSRECQQFVKAKRRYQRRGGSIAVKTLRNELKNKYIQYKGGKCLICGYNRCVRALKFHHINPALKRFEISNSSQDVPWQTIQIELDKCVLVCGNCHDEIHSNLINLQNYV